MLEVEQIAYDEELPTETFVFELPPGASARGHAEPEVTTVDAAAALASFRVFKLESVPPDWRVQAVYSPATQRPTLPDTVTLLYSRDDGGEHLRIRETTREHDLPAIGGERRFVNKVHMLDKEYIESYNRSTMAMRELLNVRETARALGVHENTVRNWESHGILRAVHLPGSGFRRFAVQDVERLRAEMFEQFTEGPIVNPGHKRSGRLVFGDATE